MFYPDYFWKLSPSSNHGDHYWCSVLSPLSPNNTSYTPAFDLNSQKISLFKCVLHFVCLCDRSISHVSIFWCEFWGKDEILFSSNTTKIGLFDTNYEIIFFSYLHFDFCLFVWLIHLRLVCHCTIQGFIQSVATMSILNNDWLFECYIFDCKRTLKYSWWSGRD